MPTFRQSLTAALLRKYPFYSGAGSLANSKLVATIAGKGDERVWCSTPGGDVLAPLNDYVGRAAYFCGDLDPKISWVCQKLVNPGDVVCDIGANVGIITMLLSKLVGERGRVYAFEPNPNCCEALNAAVTRNRRSNVVVHSLALGAMTEERELRIPPHNSGAGSLKNSDGISEGQVLKVSVRTLDEFVSANRIGSIRFIKLDVEGFESEVFKGSTRTLQTLRPNAILFEMNELPGGALTNHPVFKILLDFDYEFLSLPQGMLKVRPRAFDPSKVTAIPGHDVIAVPKGDCFKRALSRLDAQI